MKSVLATVATTLLFAASTVAQLTVNTPQNPPECEPVLITWSGGTPPYFLSILPGNQPSAAPLLSFPSTTATSLTWTVNITANTQLGLDLRDSTGTVDQSGVFTVQTGTTSCLTGSGSSSSSTGSTPGSTTSTGTTTGASTPITTPSTTPVTTPSTTHSTTATTPVTSKASSTTGAGTSTTSAPPTSAAVSAHTLNLGFVTAIGAVLFALVMA